MSGESQARPERVPRHGPRRPAGRPAPEPATADLHAHSLRSDGLMAPVALAEAAAAAGVSLFALTDHDTLAGVRELRATGAVPAGLELVAGVEINSVAPARVDAVDGELHILGLGVDPDDDAFEAILARQRDSRRVRFELMLARLRERHPGIDGALAAAVATDDDDALGRPRLARALVAIGEATSVADAFERHLVPGRRAYVARIGLGPVEAIQAIRAAGGIPALAHYAEAPRKRPLLRELIAAGLAGLEVFYRAYERDVVDGLASVATELRLLATGGTDYHGDAGSYAAEHADLWLPESVGVAVREALSLRV